MKPRKPILRPMLPTSSDRSSRPSQSRHSGRDAPAMATTPGAGTIAGTASMMNDTIRMPGSGERTVLRPALAMLYRIAVGPNADHYAARFLAYERASRLLLSWNWPAFFAPPLWAAYRVLWLPAFAFAMLPLLGAMLFIPISPSFDGSDAAWFFAALLLIWVIPGILAASIGDFFVYRRVRRQALAAERETEDGGEAASRAAECTAVSLIGGVVGFIALALVSAAIGLDLKGAFHEHNIRQQVLTSLRAVRNVEEQVEANWTTARLVPRQTGSVLQDHPNAGAILEDVHVSPENGRLRVRFGDSVPELAGKTILLAPLRDPQQRVRWLCIPVDIPRPLLPLDCRRR